MSEGRTRALSAESDPAGKVNLLTLAVLQAQRLPTAGLRSKFVIPLAIAQAIRHHLMRRGEAAFKAALDRFAPFSLLALLATLVLLFAFQG